MMIGPTIIAIAGIAFVRLFAIGGVFTCFAWFFSLLLILLTSVFFVIGLRRVIYGGQWGCFIDDEYMTWCFPHRMRLEDRQIALCEITKFVVQIDKIVDEICYSYFIET
ncbi:MAG: hypothetical protein WCI73_13865, partial [Phycisphaerae bacterium]